MVEVRNLYHEFIKDKLKVPILNDINFKIESGEFVFLCGSSGLSKFTLLNLIAGFIKPTKGGIFVNKSKISSMFEKELCCFRTENIGFIFQSHNLISYLTVKENIELPLIFLGFKKKERVKEVEATLEIVGLEEYINHKPVELSIVQQQKVSIARALAADPSLILAYDPTKNVGSKIGKDVLSLLKKINKEENITFLIVTHDNDLISECDRVLNIRDGLLSGGV